MELKIEYIAVDDLKPYEKNNKKHEDFDIGEIAKSISKYEMIDPKYCDVIIKRWETLTGEKAVKIN